MANLDRLLQVLIVVTVCLSGLLLGMGQGDFEPFLIAIVGAGSALLLVDILNWFRLPQWLANILAIIVTLITVLSFFFTGDSVRQLLGVGKLLVYLQTILLFQRKSARVYWQVLVLSLLQIVVGAVFNLGFEGGVLFIVYMLVAGFTMMLLHLYQDRQLIEQRNRDWLRHAARTKKHGSMGTRPVALAQSAPLRRSLMRRMLGHFGVMGFGALLFAIFLFYFLPREHSSWSGPRETPMKVTGFAKKVDLNHGSIILLSTRLEMTVRYINPTTGGLHQTASQPYLRGMALSNLKVDDNVTTWVAPPYQIFNSDFRAIRRGNSGNKLLQEIVLEPTDDPLLYTAMPPSLPPSELQLTQLDYEWCWPLGALTRQRSSENIAVTHFRYRLEVPVLPNGDFFESWPYAPRSRAVPLTADGDPGIYKWLTYLDPARYPTLVSTSRQIVADSGSSSHLVQARQMEEYLQDESRFSYLLDFRNVDRNPDIDSVEDFFANFRSGHCEYFASALTLMLRSQGIPARMVVGFRGGDVNEFGGHLDVEARHAHAWVEAYIRPQDCTEAMRESRQAGRLGAWLRLDPTPAVDLDSDLLANADDALGFAKSLWRDYVLGLQDERRGAVVATGGFKLAGMLRFLDLDFWQQSFKDFGETIREPGGWKKYLPVLGPPLLVVLGVVAWFLWRRSRTVRPQRKGARQPVKAGWLRRSLARAVATVSPTLGQWIAPPASAAVEVPFYRRLTRLLDKAGYHRTPSQTQREFAAAVSQQSDAADAGSQIGALTKTITDFYYLVRFGRRPLDEQEMETVNSALSELESQLATTRPAEPA